MTDWTKHSAALLKAAYEGGQVSALEVVDQYLARQARSSLNAFITPLPERARERARQVDRRRKAGEPLGALAGIPVAVKDNIATTFAPTTCASRILEGYRSPYDAGVIERLEGADAVIVGKTNMDEFAMGSSNENSAFGPVANPRAPGRVPGGSSGGSAAAVAGRLACLALGSDTGGSVRQPAAFCGCVGFKPSYGAVSRYGLVAFASSLDQIGPLGRSAADVTLLFDVIAGPDRRDATSAGRDLPPVTEEPGRAPAPLTIGVFPAWQAAQPDREAREESERLLAVCREAGHTVVEIDLPHVHLGIAAYYVVANAEASANLARFDGVRFGYRAARPKSLHDLYLRTRGEGFGAEVKRRIMLGTYVLSAGYYEAYYLRALKVRNRIREDFARAFGRVDVILSPTVPRPAFGLGEKIDDPLAMYLSDVYTVPANLAGLPAISLPLGMTADGLPLAVQLWGPRYSDRRLLAAASRVERLLDFDAHSA
jgi:aspartyl-tRNA(Asn)/glutamyl-tRNA(Gln) amidotransferase subunit A